MQNIRLPFKHAEMTCLIDEKFSGGILSHRCDIRKLSSASSFSSSGSASSSSLLQQYFLALESDWDWEFWQMEVLQKPSSSIPASKSTMAWSWLPSATKNHIIKKSFNAFAMSFFAYFCLLQSQRFTLIQ